MIKFLLVVTLGYVLFPNPKQDRCQQASYKPLLMLLLQEWRTREKTLEDRINEILVVDRGIAGDKFRVQELKLFLE